MSFEPEQKGGTIYTRKWRAANPEKARYARRESRYRLRYGITTPEYEELLDAQGRCCAICGKHESRQKRRLHVEHDHKTGEIRGIVCHRCNLALTYFDDEKLREGILKYLSLDD